MSRATAQEPRLAARTPPFAAFEWMIAWRYLRARRAEGGVSVMTWISLIGIALAVFALIATLSVRSGFREEFVSTILGINAHVTVYPGATVSADGQVVRTTGGYEGLAERIRAVPGVVRAAPVVRGQVLANRGEYNTGVQVYGMSPEDLRGVPGLNATGEAQGDLDRFGEGIVIGAGVARELGVGVGDRIQIISPNGVRTAMGTVPRRNAYEVVYIFSAGRWDADSTRAYLPLEEAQAFFNKEGVVDEIEVMVEDPERIDAYVPAIMAAAGEGMLPWTWRDSAGSYLNALEVEDNVMFVILSILVLIAAMNIVSGLIMLVKNKGRDIGILRTMGLTEGSVLRVFFLCGAFTGIVGTAAGVVLGVLFALNGETIFAALNYLSNGGIWDPSIRGIYRLPTRLEWADVASAVVLSLFLSFVVTIFPARRAARMNPVEALRYE
jgi:lipoprotein-releasing system permease protein